MPPLSFMKCWKPKILSGEKRQTIRADGKRQYKVGDTLYIFCSMRTKQCERLGWSGCTGVTRLRRMSSYWWQRKGGRRWVNLTEPELARLAKDDGFESVAAFEFWFADYPDRQLMNAITWGDIRKGKPA